jgi:nucleoside-diphosphate-sugar epimerase
MKVLVTGGAGFLGRRLANRLLQLGKLKNAEGEEEKIDQLVLFDVVPAQGFTDSRVRVVTGSVADEQALSSVVDTQTGSIFHLAAVVSSEAEADFDLGMNINLDASRLLFDICRRVGHCPKVVFASSLAVYGGHLPDVVHDDTATNPRTSFGVQKAMTELLLADYRRKGFIDGRALRLPTVAVRQGKPNKAASSFSSDIIREPLNNKEAVCPVTADMHLWLISPRQAVECLITGHNLGAEAFGLNHVINLPGVNVRVGDMVEILGKIAGPAATRKIRWEADPAIQRIISSWPTSWDVRRAHMLGFKGDVDFETIVRNYIKDDLVG